MAQTALAIPKRSLAARIRGGERAAQYVESRTTTLRLMVQHERSHLQRSFA